MTTLHAVRGFLGQTVSGAAQTATSAVGTITAYAASFFRRAPVAPQSGPGASLNPSVSDATVAESASDPAPTAPEAPEVVPSADAPVLETSDPVPSGAAPAVPPPAPETPAVAPSADAPALETLESPPVPVAPILAVPVPPPTAPPLTGPVHYPKLDTYHSLRPAVTDLGWGGVIRLQCFAPADLPDLLSSYFMYRPISEALAAYRAAEEEMSGIEEPLCRPYRIAFDEVLFKKIQIPLKREWESLPGILASAPQEGTLLPPHGKTAKLLNLLHAYTRVATLYPTAKAQYKQNCTQKVADEIYERFFGTLPSARWPRDVIWDHLHTRLHAEYQERRAAIAAMLRAES